MAISATNQSRSLERVQHLDFKLVIKGTGMFGIICMMLAVFTTDPVAFGLGALVPWACLRIVYTPTTPAALVYFFVWQWLQVFSRIPLSWIDGESLATGLGGPNVLRAYWYMMLSLLVLAIVFRAVLSRLKPPTQAQRVAHFRWTVRDITLFYILGFATSLAAGVIGKLSGGLDQPAQAMAQLKVVALFTLFIYCMSTGRARNLLLGVILFEVGIGFTGLLSDFRSVFIFLGIAAVAARVEWKFTTGLASVVGLVVLTVLALWWTAVKNDYRQFATGGLDTQATTVALGDRMAYLGKKAVSFGDIDFGDSSYALLSRFAYVNIFASVIDVQEVSPEPIFARQWKDALAHVFQPRFLFPDKPDLLDSEVYVRLTGRSFFEAVSAGTSISVGYMGENFADFGFPGMLIGIAMMGLILAGGLRIVMSFQLPWVMREGVAMAFAFFMARDGVEVALPKMLGSALMFIIVFASALKFVGPRIVAWLELGAASAARRPPVVGARARAR